MNSWAIARRSRLRRAPTLRRSHSPVGATYQAMLTKNGHTLTNVEKVMSGELSAEDIDISR